MDDDLILDAPVDSPAGAPAAPEPPSVRDLLSKQVNPLFTESGEPKDSLETPQSREEERIRVKRDPAGKFTRRNADGSEVPTEAQVAKAQPNLSLDPNEPLDDEGSETDAQREDPLPNVDNAPKSWKAVAKEKWATADPVVKAEVHRRERDMQRAAQEHAPIKKFVGEFQQVIQPYAQHYRESGITPLQLMRNLMQSDVVLSTAPMAERAKFMAHLIGAYKIDINALDAALSGGDPSQEPNAQIDRMLNERLAPISQFVQSEQQRRQQVIQAENERAQTVLQRMATDAENFPHFALVTQDMADVTELAMKRGVYLTPAQAYARAVALNPEAQAAEQGRAGQQRASQAHDAATRSLGASLSVSGSPAGLKQKVEPSDLRGTIQAAWDQAQGR